MQKELVSKILKNGTPHSRYFSDELGVPNFLIKIQNKCLPYRKTYCIIQIWKKKVGNFMQIVSSYGVEIKKRIYRSALRWIFSESSFLSDSGVCRDLERTFRNPKSSKTL